MEVYQLEVKRLTKNKDNFLNPLSERDYKELRESISRYGVLEPLIVVQETNGLFTVIAGNNRLDIAIELGMKTVPCVIIDKLLIEGAFDTEIFRRHLTEEEKAKYKSLKEDLCKKVINEELKKRLLPEIYENYINGEINIFEAFKIAEIGIENQLKAFKAIKKEDVIELGEVEENPEYKKVLEEKDKEIERLKKEKEELAKWKLENENKIKELMDDLNKMEKKYPQEVGKKLSEEIQKQIDDLNRVNEDLRRQLKEKDKLISKYEEIESEKKEKERAEKVEQKARLVLELENRKKYMVNVVLLNLDLILQKLKETRKVLLESELPIKDFNLAREKIGDIVNGSKELLTLIRSIRKEEKKYETKRLIDLN